MTKSLAHPRATAYARQAGLCFYCDSPMWTSNPREFARRHNITLAQAMRLQCTAEHLKARQDGGTDSPSNIVAACQHCNQGRHRRKQAPLPERFRQFVRKRMSKGRWHGNWALRSFGDLA
jgi:5-methylcytosine-specific restriction endonuclease McrA